MLWTNTTFFIFSSTEPFSLRHVGPCLGCHNNPHFPMRQLTAPTNCLHCTAAPYLWASVNKLHRSSYYTAPFFVQRHLLFKSRTICCLYCHIVQRIVEKTTTTTKKTGWQEFVRALRNVFRAESYRDTSINITHCIPNNAGRNDRSNLLQQLPPPLPALQQPPPSHSFIRRRRCFGCQTDGRKSRRIICNRWHSQGCKYTKKEA